MPDERLLEAVQGAVPGAFDRVDDPTRGLNGQKEAGQHGSAIQKNGAGSARPDAAPLFGPGQVQVFSERVQQRAARGDPEVFGPAVHGHPDQVQRVGLSVWRGHYVLHYDWRRRDTSLTAEYRNSTLAYVMARRSMPTPAEIMENNVSRELRITWSDGHVSRYGYRTLRRHCPCAMCVHEWTGEKLLDPSRVSAEIFPKEIAQVGAYALRFTWSDGHMTGIYTFAFLRSLCECDACSRSRADAPAPPPS